MQFFTKRLTGLESLSSWLAATWALVLFHPTSYFEKYPQLFHHISDSVNESTLVFCTATYFIFTIALFETQYWRVVSLLHFTVYAGTAYFFLHGDPNGQIGYAYAVIAIFNLIRWITYTYEQRLQTRTDCKNN